MSNQKNNPLGKQIWSRISEHECKLLDAAAKMAHMNRSSFIRYCILEQLKKFGLNTEK